MTHVRLPQSPLRRFGVALVVLATVGARPVDAATGMVTVTVLTAAGSPADGVVVTAVGSGLALAMATVAATVRFLLLPGVYVITVHRPPACPVEQTVTVGTADMVVPIVMPSFCNDQLAVAPAVDAIAVLDVRSDMSPSCVNDQTPLLQGVGSLVLAGNAKQLTSGGSTCQGAAAILSKDHAFWFSNDPALLPWSDALGDLVTVTLAPDRLAVPMKIFLASGALANTDEATKVSLIRGTHLVKAELGLHDSYTGLRLVASSGAGDPEIENLAVTHPDKLAKIGRGCANTSTIIGDADIYDPGRLNVYYVDAIDVGGIPSSNSGRNCVAYGAPNIIFLANANPYTLIHEVGHALGLQRPSWGHTDAINGFVRDVDNSGLDIMQENASLAAKYFSVGQVTWMHLDTRSWLNLPSALDASSLRKRAAGGGVPVVDVCRCPEDELAQNCSALALDVPRTGAPNGAALHPQACSVVPDTPTIVLKAGCSTLVTARLWRGTTPARADMEWVSTAPEIVTAAEADPIDHSTKRGNLTGVMPGTARVRVWASGSFADIGVTVNPATGTCP